jgi:hypothetical protein
VLIRFVSSVSVSPDKVNGLISLPIPSHVLWKSTNQITRYSCSAGESFTVTQAKHSHSPALASEALLTRAHESTQQTH